MIHIPRGRQQRLELRAGGVAQRPEYVEHGAQRQLAARHRGESKRRMEHGREEKADPRLIDAPGNAFRREVDLDPELLEDVGRTAQR